MEYNDILNSIKERWIKSERYELINELENAPSGAATGSEGIGMTNNFLISLNKKNPDAYNEIEDLIEAYYKKSLEYGLKLRRAK